jgi:hypothetical protein
MWRFRRGAPESAVLPDFREFRPDPGFDAFTSPVFAIIPLGLLGESLPLRQIFPCV